MEYSQVSIQHNSNKDIRLAGQGRFGKVYTVVNNQTGELLAMKEVQLKPGDHGAIRNAAEELQIFEGIKHPHLVRYYGLEIRRVCAYRHLIITNLRSIDSL